MAQAPPPYEGIEKKEQEYKLPALPYGYEGLEPYIDKATLTVHHQGHHAAYTAKMNTALGQWRADAEVSHMAHAGIASYQRQTPTCSCC